MGLSGSCAAGPCDSVRRCTACTAACRASSSLGFCSTSSSTSTSFTLLVLSCHKIHHWSMIIRSCRNERHVIKFCSGAAQPVQLPAVPLLYWASALTLPPPLRPYPCLFCPVKKTTNRTELVRLERRAAYESTDTIASAELNKSGAREVIDSTGSVLLERRRAHDYIH